MLLLHFVLEEKLVANKLLYNNLYSCVVVKVNHCIMLVYKFKWAMLTSVPFFFSVAGCWYETSWGKLRAI